MKVTKLILGTVSFVFAAIIIFQSCAAGVYVALDGNTADTSGTAGMFLAITMVIAGIVGVATRNFKVGAFITGALYILAAVFGITGYTDVFGDLAIWIIVSSFLGFIFIGFGVIMTVFPEKKKEQVADTEDI